MEPRLSYCGFRCDLCLAYRPNIEKHPDSAQSLSDGWHTYFGFRIPPEKIICEGCRSQSLTTLDSECPVRPCANSRQVENCAACEGYICEKLSSRLIDFQSIQKDFVRPIPEEDRSRFIFPYENVHRLARLRMEKE